MNNKNIARQLRVLFRSIFTFKGLIASISNIGTVLSIISLASTAISIYKNPNSIMDYVFVLATITLLIISISLSRRVMDTAGSFYIIFSSAYSISLMIILIFSFFTSSLVLIENGIDVNNFGKLSSYFESKSVISILLYLISLSITNFFLMDSGIYANKISCFLSVCTILIVIFILTKYIIYRENSNSAITINTGIGYIYSSVSFFGILMTGNASLRRIRL